MATDIWRKAKYRLVTSGTILVIGLGLSSTYFNIANRALSNKLIAYIGIIIFVSFSILFLRLLTATVNQVIANRRLGIGRAAAIQFILRIIGYLIIILTTLALLNISVAKLLLGGAIIGIVLGVAAQQSLVNFFASIVLIITHPYRVGEEVTIISGALGGKYQGVITDIGLTHTRLKQLDGQEVYMPNSTVLAGSAIIPNRFPNKNIDD